MQIACPSCKMAFALDDAKAPVKPVVTKCPSCGGPIPVSPPLAAGAAPAAPAYPAEPPARPAPPGFNPAPPRSAPPPGFHPAAPPAVQPPAPLSAEALPEETAAEDQEAEPVPGTIGRDALEKLKHEVTMEVMRHFGVKTSHMAAFDEDEDSTRPKALVCETEQTLQAIITSAVEKLGFKAELAPTKEAALAMLPKKNYEVITVDSRFPDDAEGGYEILRTINSSPSDVRREVFVAFISADVATLDANLAFVLGANLTVAKRDLRRLDKILTQSLREHQKMYKVFRQVQEELEHQDT